MKIYFVRHGQTQHNKDELMAGHTDGPLHDDGVEQARKLASELPNDYTVMYSSDLLRCKQTAEILSQKLRLPVKYDSRLRERFFGSLEGKRWTDSDVSLKEIDKNQKYNYRPHGGESVEDVKKRVLDFIKDVKKEIKENDKVLVVTSGGVIRLLHHIIKGAILEHSPNASMYEFDFPNNL